MYFNLKIVQKRAVKRQITKILLQHEQIPAVNSCSWKQVAENHINNSIWN